MKRNINLKKVLSGTMVGLMSISIFNLGIFADVEPVTKSNYATEFGKRDLNDLDETNQNSQQGEKRMIGEGDIDANVNVGFNNGTALNETAIVKEMEQEQDIIKELYKIRRAASERYILSLNKKFNVISQKILDDINEAVDMACKTVNEAAIVKEKEKAAIAALDAGNVNEVKSVAKEAIIALKQAIAAANDAIVAANDACKDISLEGAFMKLRNVTKNAVKEAFDAAMEVGSIACGLGMDEFLSDTLLQEETVSDIIYRQI